MPEDTITGAAAPAARPKFKGQAFELGGTTYIVPPLALGDVKEFLPRIRDMKFGDADHEDTSFGTIADVITAAFQRNYPEMSADAIMELVDMGNMFQIFAVIMGKSGLKQIPTGDAASTAGATSGNPDRGDAISST